MSDNFKVFPSSASRRHRGTTGFSLIELLVAVAIVAILAGLAYPSYSRYVIRANRSAAQQFMLDVAARQEQYLLDARRYAATLDDLQITPPADVARYYQSILKVDNAAAPPLYQIIAEPVPGTYQAADPVLTLSSTGLATPIEHW